MSEDLELRNRYRMKEWAEIVSQCCASGLSNREFCRRNGISEKTFYYRLRKLREKAAETEGEVTLCRIEPESSPQYVGTVHVRYHEADIEVSRDTNPDTLKMALRALSEI